VSFFEGATDTNSHGQQIPSFVDSNTADQMQTTHQDAEYPDTELREQRMQNYAMLVEAATLAREAEMGTTVNLGEWFENSLRYIQERYSNVYGSLGKKPGTNIIIVRLSANGAHGTAEFRDGVDGTRVDRDGNIFVNPQVLWNAFGRVIDPPITHTPVADSIRFGLGVGAVRGVGRVVNWLDRIANNVTRRQVVTSNKGNPIDITPARDHKKITGNPFTGRPNSSVDIFDSRGVWVRRRWFGSDGRFKRDVDMTNHGAPNKHPEWPHEHLFR